MASVGETLLALTEVPNFLPRRRGRKIHYSTVFRWATKGARGKVLQSRLIGGIRYTTREGLEQFLSGEPAPQEVMTVDIAAINRVLDHMGI